MNEKKTWKKSGRKVKWEEERFVECRFSPSNFFSKRGGGDEKVRGKRRGGDKIFPPFLTG